MAQVAVITDSTASLPESFYERYGLLMVPYYVHMEGRVLRDMVDLRPAEFNAYMANLPDGAQLPSTATPGPGDYIAAFQEAAKRARQIISFHMTSVGSGAYQSARVAREMIAQQLKGARIEVVDTRNVSMCHGWMALQAAREAIEGASLDDILEGVRRAIPVARMLQTADTLRYLYMGGRIGRAQHLVGSALHIRPLISMEDGVIVTLGVARSRQGAYQRMAALVGKAMGAGGRVRLALTHAAAAAEAETLRQLVSQVVTPVETLMCELSPALTVHSGPGTVGLCYLPV